MPSRAFFVSLMTMNTTKAQEVTKSQCPRGHFLFRSTLRVRHRQWASGLVSQCPRGHFLFRSNTDGASPPGPQYRRLNALAGIFCFAQLSVFGIGSGRRGWWSQCPRGHFLFRSEADVGQPVVGKLRSLNALAGIFCFAQKEPGTHAPAQPGSQCPRGHFLFRSQLSTGLSHEDRNRVSMPSRAFFVSLEARPADPEGREHKSLNALAGIFCFAQSVTQGLKELALQRSQCPRGHFLFRSELP